MSPRKPSKEQIHAEMLRHLEQHPPAPPAPGKPPRKPRKRKPEPAPPLPERPTLMLRRLRLATAMERLASFVRFHAARGTPEILVIVGKGQQSEAGAVIAPAVRAWCADEPSVKAVREAGLREGGAGALVLTLGR